MVELLLNAVKDANELEATGKSALHLAVVSAHTDVVDVLVKHGADLDIQDHHVCDLARNILTVLGTHTII